MTHSMTPATDDTQLPQEIQDLLEAATKKVDLSPKPEYPQAVNDRLAESMQHAEAAMKKVPTDTGSKVEALLVRSMQAKTARQRIEWHHKAADIFYNAVQPHSACKQGCNHCCHIAVTISQQEAEYIGREIGRKPRRLSESNLGSKDTVTKEPRACTFLVDGACSIYGSRPSVCRTQLSMDKDDLLCQLVPGTQIPVPYARATAFQMSSVLITGNGLWADIRDWFPVDAAE